MVDPDVSGKIGDPEMPVLDLSVNDSPYKNTNKRKSSDFVSEKDEHSFDVESNEPFDWLDELNKIATEEEVKQIAIKENMNAKNEKVAQIMSISTWIDSGLDLNQPNRIEEFNWQEELDKYATLTEINKVIEEEKKEAKLIENMDGDHIHKKQKLMIISQECSKPFNWDDEMAKRVKRKGKTYRCVGCGFKTPGHTSMVTHLETHHMKEIKVFKCPNCESMCDSFLTFNEHMKIVHGVKLSLLNKI